jgi:DNA-directed RNA polymerase subunit RPC12/RpoP
MPKKYELSEVKKKLQANNLIMIKDEYINSKAKFDIVDNEGYKYEISFGEYLQYNKILDRFSKFNIHTINNIKLWLKLNNYKNELLSKEYINSDKKLTFTCEDCGEPYEVTFKHFRNANQIKCKKCNRKLATEKDKFSLDYTKEYFKSKGLTLVEDSYTGVKQRLTAVDSEGYKIKVSYNSLKASGGVELFSKANPYTIFNIHKYIILNKLGCELLSKAYSDSRDKLIFKCECGEKFETTLNAFLHQDKNRCDYCSKKQSKLSYSTELYLKCKGLDYQYEYKIDECRNKRPLPFDFAIFNKDNSIKLLLELDGIQHFKPTAFNGADYNIALNNYEYTKQNDFLKDEYCNNNNIKLLRIPYWEFKNDNYINILNNNIYTQI